MRKVKCESAQMPDGTWSTAVIVSGMTEDEANQVGDALARPVFAAIKELWGEAPIPVGEATEALVRNN